MSVSRVAPPRVLSRACIPGRTPVHEPRWFRASLCRYLRRLSRRRQEGRACLGRPNPEVRRDAMGRVPFPPLPTVIGARPLVLLTFFNFHVLRGRRLRAPQVCTRSCLARYEALPRRSIPSKLSKNHSPGQKKPRWFANRPGLFAGLEGSMCKPSGPVVRKGLLHGLAAVEFMRIHALALRPRPLRPRERIAVEDRGRVSGR